MERISISVVTCNRLNFLIETIKAFEQRIKIPYHLIVVDNGSTDGTQAWLQKLKKNSSFPIDLIYNKIPVDLAHTSTQGLELSRSKFFINSMNDILIPDLSVDVLQQLIEMIDRRVDLGVICLRTAQMKRNFPKDEEVLIVDRACPAYFRITRTEEMRRVGGFGHGRWEDGLMVKICKELGKNASIATDLWAKDLGTAPDRGYSKAYCDSLKGSKYFEWGANPRPQYVDPNIKLDELTNKPI